MNLITGCTDGVSQTWDLSARRVLSTTIPPGQSEVAAIGPLAPITSSTPTAAQSPYTRQPAPPLPSWRSNSAPEIRAIATHGISTVVAATTLGLVALEIPH